MLKPKQADKFTRKNFVLTRVILSYLLIGVVLLSALSFFLYNNFLRYSMTEIENIAENMTQQYYNISDKLFNSIYNYFYSLYFTDYVHTTDFSIFAALYSDEFTEQENANIRRKLTAEVMANPWIYSIYIYNRRAGVVFSNISSVLSIAEFYDRDIISIINNRHQILNPVYIPRKVEYVINSRLTRLNTLTILYTEYSSTDIPEAAMVVNIDLQELQNIFANHNNRAQMFILDRNGVVLSHVNTLLINTDMSEEEYIRRILSGNDNNGCFIANINGHDNLVSYIKSERALGWNIIRIDDMNDLLRNTHNVQRNVLILTCLFIMAGIFIAAYFTIEIHIPLDKRLKNLSISVKKFEPIRKDYLLKHILDGTTNTDELNELGLSTIDTNAQGFIILVLGFDSFYRLNELHPAETIASYKRSVTNAALKALNNTLGNINCIETYENYDDHICLIISLFDDSKETIKKIESAAAETINYVKDNFDFRITASISDIAGYLVNVGSAYNNALRYLNYKIVLGCGRVITGDKMAEMNFTPYEYPLKKEKQLIEALKLCDKTATERQLDEILDAVRNFSYDEIMLSFMQLALGSIRAVETIINIQDMPARFEYSNIFKNMGKFDSMAEIREWFMKLYSWVIDVLNAKRDTRKDTIVEKLEDYINNHHADPNLSIDLLADTVGLSTNYVRIIYKEKTNRSLSSYISDIRLKKAEELLLTTNTSINKIPEMVGFQSSGYFYKNFKKRTGKTPDQYRKDRSNADL